MLESYDRKFRVAVLVLLLSNIPAEDIPLLTDELDPDLRSAEWLFWAPSFMLKLAESLQLDEHYLMAYSNFVPTCDSRIARITQPNEHVDDLSVFENLLHGGCGIKLSNLLIDVILFLIFQSKYDAKGRTLMRNFCMYICISPNGFLYLEQQVAKHLLLASEKKSDGSATSGTLSDKKAPGTPKSKGWRYAKIGGMAIGVGAILAVTGGLAAPAVAAGLIAMGATGTAAVASVGVMAGVFGGVGGGLAGYKMSRRTAGLQEFEFEKCEAERSSLAVMIVISGFMNEENDDRRSFGVMPQPEHLSMKERWIRFYLKHDPDHLVNCQQYMEHEIDEWECDPMKCAEIGQKYECDPLDDDVLLLAAPANSWTSMFSDEAEDDCLKYLERAVAIAMTGVDVSGEKEKDSTSTDAATSAFRRLNPFASNSNSSGGDDSSGNVGSVHVSPSTRTASSSSANLPPAPPVAVASVSTPASHEHISSTRTALDAVTYTSFSGTRRKESSDEVVEDEVVEDEVVEENDWNQVPTDTEQHVEGTAYWKQKYWNWQQLPIAKNYELYNLKWETKMQIELGQTLNKFIRQLGGTAAKGVVAYTAFAAVAAAVAMPMLLIKLTDLIDSTWTIAIERADAAGRELARALARGVHGTRPVTLIGHSIGARVVYACLKELARMQAAAAHAPVGDDDLLDSDDDDYIPNTRHEGDTHTQQHTPMASNEGNVMASEEALINTANAAVAGVGKESTAPVDEANDEPKSALYLSTIVQDVVLLGAPVSSTTLQWLNIRNVVSGRIINGFSSNDLLLSILYRYERMKVTVAGISPIYPSGGWRKNRKTASESNETDQTVPDATILRMDTSMVENIDLSHLIGKHTDYCLKMQEILQQLNLGGTLNSVVPPDPVRSSMLGVPGFGGTSYSSGACDTYNQT